MKKYYLLSLFIIIGLTVSLTVFAISWSTLSLTKHNDIILATDAYQPSGLAWNSITNKLFTVCNTGKVTVMNMDGTAQVTTVMPYYMDFEAITLINPNSTKLYIGNENPDSILEYDSQTKSLTGKSWDLTGIMNGADNSGLEGLTFVPNGYHSFANSASGGLFYAAIQRSPILNDGVNYNDYLIYAFDIDLNTNNKVVNWYGIPVAANTPNYDISDLYFNQETKTLFVLYDGANRLVEMKTDGTVINDYSDLPVNEQEGLVIKTTYPSLTADIYLASDSDKLIGWYSGFPVDFDFDNDGKKTSVDCNDKDNVVWNFKTFYYDFDGDGLGQTLRTAYCTNILPAGYVSNSNDLNDHDFDNDAVSTVNDCNDKNATISQLQKYYVDTDNDGLGGDGFIELCTWTVPTNFVTNSDDLNDYDHDNDGIITSTDCNDNDKYILGKINYYQDLDFDGLGFGPATQACAIPSSQHVTNNLDQNDNDFDNDGIITTDDCNDHDKNILGKINYYQDLDFDGLGFGSATGACTVPATNYVTNNNDLNDNDHDNDGFITTNDCNDNDKSILGKINYYLDLDNDGLGFGTAHQACSFPSSHHVTNNSDQNDYDHDNDNITTTNDCNDNNSQILGKQNYYPDLDNDGLGFGVAMLSCLAPATNYVNNNNDYNDSDHDNDGIETKYDCNDNDKTKLFIKQFYQDFDGDGLGNVNVVFQGCSAPLGYVSNANDKNDYDYDNDGVSMKTDCNDKNSRYWIIKTYYLDADKDGFGFYGKYTTANRFTGCVPPNGFVTNNTDKNDKDPLIH